MSKYLIQIGKYTVPKLTQSKTKLIEYHQNGTWQFVKHNCNKIAYLPARDCKNMFISGTLSNTIGQYCLLDICHQIIFGYSVILASGQQCAWACRLWCISLRRHCPFPPTHRTWKRRGTPHSGQLPTLKPAKTASTALKTFKTKVFFFFTAVHRIN